VAGPVAALLCACPAPPCEIDAFAFGSPLRAAYGLRQRTPDFVRLAKTTSVRLELDARAAANSGRGLRRRVMPHVVHVVG
jgi:hypothetical protein